MTKYETKSVSKKIAKKIGDRYATIAIEITDLFLNCDRDLNFHKDRDCDRDRDFGDRANALPKTYHFWKIAIMNNQ